MEESNKVKLIFGEPKDGWLPTKLTSDEFQLEFNASRIPENPIGSLCESLILVMNGVESECEWNLEPEKYIFGFKQNGSRFVLSIFKKEKLTERIWECTGGFDSIILPLYRGLKNLNSINFGSNDWDQIDQAVLTKLDNLIIDRKTKTA